MPLEIITVATRRDRASDLKNQRGFGVLQIFYFLIWVQRTQVCPVSTETYIDNMRTFLCVYQPKFVFKLQKCHEHIRISLSQLHLCYFFSASHNAGETGHCFQRARQLSQGFNFFPCLLLDLLIFFFLLYRGTELHLNIMFNT